MSATPHTKPPLVPDVGDLPEVLNLWWHRWPNRPGRWLQKNLDTGKLRLIEVGDQFHTRLRAAYYGPVTL